MTKKDDHATKADIAGLKSAFAGLKDDFARLEAKSVTKDDIARFEAKSATKDDLSRVEGRLDAKIDRVAIEVVRSQSDLREVKETMATKGQMERLMRCFDDFAARAVHYDRADATRGQALIKVEAMADDHERRITALESSPRPPQAP
ncbi:MAG: hypothetical protein PHU21_07340 [Elusimicrobia bacterium]|jgi:hypothetical protein|nr:hypothetical protein [Elusimicrobiota bacterium]